MALQNFRVSSQAHQYREEADLDITPFMNLMIVLVPVLLLSMVFTRISVIDLQLPSNMAGGDADLSQQQIEVVVTDSQLAVNFPTGILLREVKNTETGMPNYRELSQVLQELKRHLQEKQADRKNISLLIESETPYKKIVATMDAVRSYKAVVAADVVDAELFPDIAFGDAPGY